MAEDGFPRWASLPSSNLVPFGRWRHAKGREHCRGEPDSALSGWVRTRFGENGGQLDRRRARGGLNSCAREYKARTGRFLRENLISDYGLFSSYEDQHGAANGQDSWGFFRDAQGFGRLDAGSRAGFTSSRPPPPWTSVFQFPLFLYKMRGLEKLGLVDQN